MILTKRLNKAMQIAAYAHEHQKRKGTDIPYISHPFAVMAIAQTMTSDEDTLVACLFHDILEDAPERYSKELIHKDFGEAVLSIVEGVTKDSTLVTWQERADAYLHHLRHEASIESVIVSGADKYHNLLSIVSDHEQIGDAVWDKFNAGKEQQLWWYASVGEILSDRLPESKITEEYAELFTDFTQTSAEI